MDSKYCIPLVESDFDILLQKIEEASKTAQIIEIWAGELYVSMDNFLKKLDILKECETKCNVPFLLNIKDEKEKGSFTAGEEIKKQLFLEIWKREFFYLDIDYQCSEAFLDMMREIPSSTNLILSAHFFEGTPSLPSLLNRVQIMRNKKADMIKMALMPESDKDLITLFRLCENLKRSQSRFIAMAMGKRGKISRVVAPLLGSEVIFTPLDEITASAPGQISLSDMETIFSILEKN